MVNLARVAWLVLPLSTGAAFADALQDHSRAVALVATCLLYGAWLAGLVALLAPRPAGFTVLRIVAPAGAAATLVVAIWQHTSGIHDTFAIVGATLAAGCALSSPVSHAAHAALSYGTERRFPLRSPTGLLLGPVPLAVSVCGAALTIPPLLLAAQQWVGGCAAALVAVPAFAVLARSLHGLDRRFLVLVPAGLVIADPLSLVDPVLLPREHIRALQRAPGDSRADDDTLDLRLGTALGTMRVDLDEPGSFARRAGRNRTAMTTATALLFAPLRPRRVRQASGTHRLPVG